MKLETFFEKFDQFADAPDGIGTLREVILQLAVSGRLVSQSKSDAPVDVGRLDEQAAPRKQAEGRSGASLEAVTEDEIAEEIPDSWVWVRLFRLCEPDAPIVYGILQPGPDVRPNGVPYVRPTEIKDGRIRLSEIRHTSPDIAAQYTRATIRKGDVLLTIVGTLGATAVVPKELDGGNITQSSCRLRPDSRFIDTSYLVLCLRSRTLLNQYRGFSLGSAVQRLNIAHVRALAIPLPPLAEQKRIVAKVDELMALCDRLEAQQQERETRHAALARASLARFADAPTPANLHFLFHPSYSIPPADLRKSILTLAVQGKLIPQDPNDEPAERLFGKLESERRRFADVHKFRAPLGEPVDDASAPFAIPPSWKWCRLSSLFNAVTDGDHLPPPKSDDGIAFLTIGNITTGTLDFEGSRFVPDSYYRGLADFRRPIRGDILYTVVGATYGRPALVETDRPFCVQRHIAILKPPRSVDVGFLMALLRSPLAYDQASASTTGTAQPTIPLGSLRNFWAPLPPLAEQRRIVAKVEQLMALVDALEQQLAASRATAANLLSALVAELTGTANTKP